VGWLGHGEYWGHGGCHPTVGLTGEVDDKALPIGKGAGTGVRLKLDSDIGSGGVELEAAAGTRVLAQDACRQVVPIVEGQHVPCAQPQPGVLAM